MPIGFGIGVSHAPGMYLKAESDWDRVWELLSLDRGVPQPAKVADEKGEVLQDWFRRIDAGHVELKRQFDEYGADVLIIIGGDQNETFDGSNMPQIMFFLGAHEQAHRPGGPMPKKGEPYSPRMSNLPPLEMDIDVESSKAAAQKLVKQEGFDIAFSYEAKPLGRGHGLPHAFGNPSSYLLEGKNTPTVIVYENTFDAPSLSAKRCYDLGAALARSPATTRDASPSWAPAAWRTTPAASVLAGSTNRWTAGSWSNWRRATAAPPRPCTPSSTRDHHGQRHRREPRVDHRGWGHGRDGLARQGARLHPRGQERHWAWALPYWQT